MELHCMQCKSDVFCRRYNDSFIGKAEIKCDCGALSKHMWATNLDEYIKELMRNGKIYSLNQKRYELLIS